MKINWSALALGVILLVLVIYNGCSQSKLNDARNLLAAKDDTIHTLVNRLGQETSSRIAYQTSSDFFIKQLKGSNDSLLISLSKRINKNTVSATDFKTATASQGEWWPDNMSGDSCNPVFHKTFISEWDSIDITADRHRIKYTYEVYNEFKVDQTYKPQGLFKPKQLNISVTNLNPHTKTLALQSFHIPYPVHKIGIGPVMGIGINNSFKPVPFVGIGIQWSLIRF
jgi:hypothetical protein